MHSDETTTPPAGAAASDEPPTGRKPLVVLGALSIVLLVVVAVGLAWQRSQPKAPTSELRSEMVGKAAPRLIDTTIDGKEFDLENVLHDDDKPVLLVFWAHWCPHCRKVMPEIEKLHERAGDRFNIVSVTTALRQQPAPAGYETPGDFARTVGLTMPVVLDLNSVHELTWGVSEYPQLYYLDAKGRVRDVQGGEVPIAEVEKTLEGIAS